MTTLLDLVQTIAASLDSDEINSIGDSTESMQIAYVVRDTYNDIVSHLELPAHFDFFELTASGDATKPTLMTLPANVKSVEWIKYDNRDTGGTSPMFRDVAFVPLDDFLSQMNQLNSETMTNVGTFSHTVTGLGTFDFLYYNDRFPCKYTTWDDYTIIFDSFDVSVDTTLTANKSQGYGEISQTFTMEDDFVIPFDDRQYSLLLNEAKNQAFAELKQTQNVVSGQRARRAWITEQRLKKKVRNQRYYDSDLPDYGWKR